jgi:hypothetical protein
MLMATAGAGELSAQRPEGAGIGEDDGSWLRLRFRKMRFRENSAFHNI